MMRYLHRSGVGIIPWRLSGSQTAAATLAPRNNHYFVFGRGRRARLAYGSGSVGASAVQSDVVASYVVREAVQSDIAASYEILTASAVASSLVSTYNISAAVQADVVAAYAIRAAVQSDVVSAYSILSAGAVASSLVASYGIFGAVQSDCVAAYAVRETVTSDLQATFIVRQQASADLAVAYFIRAAVQSDLPASYEILALSVVASDLAATYFVNGVVAVTAGPDYLTPIYAMLGQQVTHTPTVGSPAVGLALHSMPGVELFAGELLTTDHALRYARDSFPVVQKGDAFTIGGVNYVAREAAQSILDGRECHVQLARVA